MTGDILSRYILELTRSSDKPLSNFSGKLDNGDEVADAESKTHYISVNVVSYRLWKRPR